MPIYEYRCNDCGTEFEKRVPRASDGPSVRCPSCGENHLVPRLSVFSARVGASKSAAPAPPCASGVCPHPEMCGRN